MDEKLRATIAKIKALTEQNAEFARELRKVLEIPSSSPVVSTHGNVEDDIAAIRSALEIRANYSITFDFIKHERLRDQLKIDNLRMENAALNLKENENERFYTFCVNAFYQLENAVNYYFYYKFKDIRELVKIVKDYTLQEQNEDFQYSNISKGTEQSITDIPIAHKINALCNILIPDDPIKIRLGTLRQVRNEGEHRCMAIQQKMDESNHLYRFFQKSTFNSVRIDLIKVVNAIRDNMDKPIVPEIKMMPATIISVLPSVCYLNIDGKSVTVPKSLLSKVKEMSANDAVMVKIVNRVITEIIKEE